MIQTNSKPMFQEQVYTTSDYFMFKPIDGNRGKNLLHIKRLRDSIANNYLFTVIIVNEKYEIIDGQHRFEVIKELGLPLNYIICHGYGLNEVHILNANSKTWGAEDYLEGYCKLGYEDYLIYKKFKTEYKLGHRECQFILSGNENRDLVTKFYKGEFKVKDYSESENFVNKLLLLEPYYNGVRRRTFVTAMFSLMKNENFDFNEFIQKVRQQPSALTDCVNTSQYLNLIEEIYNYKRRIKVNLRY